jgi:hypothetical protein
LVVVFFVFVVGLALAVDFAFVVDFASTGFALGLLFAIVKRVVTRPLRSLDSEPVFSLVLLDLIAARAAFCPRVTAPFCWGLGEAANLALDFLRDVLAASVPPFSVGALAALAALRTADGDDLDGPPPGVEANCPEASLMYWVRRRPRGMGRLGYIL